MLAMALAWRWVVVAAAVGARKHTPVRTQQDRPVRLRRDPLARRRRRRPVRRRQEPLARPRRARRRRDPPVRPDLPTRRTRLQLALTQAKRPPSASPTTAAASRRREHHSYHRCSPPTATIA